MLAHDLERGLAAVRIQDGVAPHLERTRGEAPHRIFVLDKEDGVLARHIARRAALVFFDRLTPAFGVVARKVDIECRSFADIALDRDEAARLLDDAVNGRKPEAGSLAYWFRGEERLENLLQVFRRDALARIGHLDEHVIAGG